jgi:hypothetical protein
MMHRAILEPCPDGCSEHVTVLGGTAVEPDATLADLWRLCGIRTHYAVPTWAAWLRQWRAPARAALTAVARSLPAYGLLGAAAFEAADRGQGVSDTHWRCDNGLTVGFSHRGWGDLQAILTRVGDYRDWAWERRI